MAANIAEVAASVSEIAAKWRGDRSARQGRRHLERSDFEELRAAGLLLLPAPVATGGLWQDRATSVRPMCEIYRALAAGDPSVALVSSMHPAVIAFWLARPDPSQPDWEAQRQAVFESAVAGEQWGTITSEPGSGGDITRTRSVATPIDDEPFLIGRSYAVTGDKHFGSGSGITDRMMTTAVPDGEPEPTIFVLDVRDRPWDGTAGLSLTAEWDGMGMAATQSHAMRLGACPAIRTAWDGPIEEIMVAAAPLVASLFTSVVLGVFDEAIRTAKRQLEPKADSLRAYERVEWTRAELEHWLAVQAYEGALRIVESGDHARPVHATLRAKEGIAELAESSLGRLGRVIGGGTFSRRSPFASWFEDVRALGFLRPPWGLAYDTLFATSFS
jgi:alkylation response protein AidB-like acyl-CoA dehydrogenase